MDEILKMYAKIESMSNEEIQAVWDSLKSYNPSDMYAPNIPMDFWVEGIYIEMDKRNMSHYTHR